MVEPQPSKLMTWVRFPLPAPDKTNGKSFVFIFLQKLVLSKFYPYLYQMYKLYIQEEVKIMNKYESIVIINPNVDEAGLKALEDKF